MNGAISRLSATPRCFVLAISFHPEAPLDLRVGDPIDSSAAISGGVVCVGAGTGDLLALDLASGKLLWKYATGNLIGESSPAVGTDAVFVGDLGGLVCRESARRQAGVDVQNGR